MEKIRAGYTSALQKQRSATSPWRKSTMVMTSKALGKRKKVNQTPAGTPRPDLD